MRMVVCLSSGQDKNDCLLNYRHAMHELLASYLHHGLAKVILLVFNTRFLSWLAFWWNCISVLCVQTQYLVIIVTNLFKMNWTFTKLCEVLSGIPAKTLICWKCQQIWTWRTGLMTLQHLDLFWEDAMSWNNNTCEFYTFNVWIISYLFAFISWWYISAIDEIILVSTKQAVEIFHIDIDDMYSGKFYLRTNF